ncbi:hypothetical protein HAX54_039717 [Datura stramonium]|uniref:GDSL esterase/lipase n=1 Tax=Datura stramonium TaxID=4076 RepID=A0ABS8SJ88_DATST|nr:hypothetical protein [Datura stramonium]
MGSIIKCVIHSVKAEEQQVCVCVKMESSISKTTCTFILILACFTISQLANVVVCECSRNVVIFNFGDSNSDTGGYPAAHGIRFGFPDGRTFFHQPSDRLCDGRLILDFLCKPLLLFFFCFLG